MGRTPTGPAVCVPSCKRSCCTVQCCTSCLCFAWACRQYWGTGSLPAANGERRRCLTVRQSQVGLGFRQAEARQGQSDVSARMGHAGSRVPSFARLTIYRCPYWCLPMYQYGLGLQFLPLSRHPEPGLVPGSQQGHRADPSHWTRPPLSLHGQ